MKEVVYKRTSVSNTRLQQKMRMEVNVLDYMINGMLSIIRFMIKKY